MVPEDRLKAKRMILEPCDLMELALLDFRLAEHTSPVPTFLSLLFEMGMSVLSLCHHCVLEAHNLSGVTGSQLRMHFAWGESYL